MAGLETCPSTRTLRDRLANTKEHESYDRKLIGSE
jgi:hypothetical protein